MIKTNIKTTEQLTAFINDTHMGDYASVSRDLYKAIYFLHHLEESSVGKVELHNTLFTLQHLAEYFFDAHQDQRMSCGKVTDEIGKEIDSLLVKELKADQ